MKPTQPTSGTTRNRKGIALITVISVLAIMTVLTVAMLSLSQSERKSSVRYADGEYARNLGDTAINVVMGQIWEGSRQEEAGQGSRKLWASQPGAVRKYNPDGSFYRGYKLYSDDQMVVAGPDERPMISDTPPTNWQTLPGKWVDLNEPVIRADSTEDADNDPEVIFPIVDPRAFVRAFMGVDGNNRVDSPNVEGFSYQTTMTGVVDATTVTDINARLPMPVQWLYVLKDGTMGYMQNSGATYSFVGPNGATATVQNPIVGRIAFWTDDETSRININTAGEPTYWMSPMSYHTRDKEWATSQPTRFEYQRYPGHPATVALSSVLFPNRDLDTYGKTGAARSKIIETKERIYEIMPKINKGGSKAGTIPFWALVDDRWSGTTERNVDVSQSLKEPLYATVDELLFSQEVQAGERVTQDQSFAGSSTIRLFGDFTNEDRALERVRFFLTAQSRAPEITIHGTPRVIMWPVPNESSIGPMASNARTHRTVFDNMMVYCGTLGRPEMTTNAYYFRRGDSTSQTADVDNIRRNRELLNYLYTLMGRNYPTGGRGVSNFKSKYGDDAAQILAQIFDYIRCTNLCDPVLSPTRAELKTDPYRLSATGMTTLNTKAALLRRDQLQSTQKTFTPSAASYQRTVNPPTGYTAAQDVEQVVAGGMPGHGQVVPISFSLDGKTVRGFGRFPTLSEVGLHFICTADGRNDKHSYRIRVSDGMGGYTNSTDPLDVSGGRTALKLTNDTLQEIGSGGAARLEEEDDPFIPNAKWKARWFSNYPPYPAAGRYGTVVGASDDNPRTMKKHPGFKPENWNVTLDRNVPLIDGQRRVQAMVAFEMNLPSTGNAGIYTDLALEIEGMNSFRLLSPGSRPQALFNTIGTAKRSWRAGAGPNSAPNASLFEPAMPGGRKMGGTAGPYAFCQGRRVVGWVEMSNDPSYESAVTTGGNTYDGAANYDFVSSFVTITGDTMQFQGGPLKVNLYSSRNMTTRNLVQSFTINFASGSFPTPELVVLSTPREQFGAGGVNIQDRVDAPRWWCFNYGGAINRYAGSWDGGTDINAVTRKTPDTSVDNRRTLGRFYTVGSNWGTTRGGNQLYGLPRLYSLFWLWTPGWLNATYMRPRMGGDTGLEGRTNTYYTPDTEGPYGQDVVFSVVPKHGDTRLLALMKDVPATEWEPHPNYGAAGEFSAHSFTRYTDPENGAKYGAESGSNPNLRLAPYAAYHANSAPDLPQTSEVSRASRYGDFDNGQGCLRDGPWINKPDEGDTGIGQIQVGMGSGIIRYVSAYYHRDSYGANDDAGESYMSPNRIISSPGMFGSLPTGLNAREPWRTLLFRPYSPPPGSNERSHPGSPDYGVTATSASDTTKTPFAGKNPGDHLLMDLFWMPVVEPYAISEPLSTAGKINMNYQMVPFNTYIRRATAIHAAMKGEMMETVDTASANFYHRRPNSSLPRLLSDGAMGQYYQWADWSDLDERSTKDYYSETTQKRFWHRKIDLETKSSRAATATMAQFDDRFNFSYPGLPSGAQGLFRTATQICEIFLVPKKVQGTAPAAQVVSATVPASDGSDSSPGTPYSYRAMSDFWQARAVTGDNIKERPYANLYAKLTTQSNTFRVYYRAQVIRKARSVDPNSFDPFADDITSDYRGSAVIERRIDPNDARIPDYATNDSATPLENFYNFRVLENKRFAP